MLMRANVVMTTTAPHVTEGSRLLQAKEGGRREEGPVCRSFFASPFSSDFSGGISDGAPGLWGPGGEAGGRGEFRICGGLRGRGLGAPGRSPCF